MENSKEIINNIKNNLIYYRTKNGLTQIELSEKIGYSNKSISKWETGDGIPDVLVLNKMANIFGVTLNDLIDTKKVKIKKNIIKMRYLKAVFTALIPWFIATLLFIIFVLKNIDFIKPWVIFIYAIPISAIIFTIYFSIWKKRISQYISLSIIAWLIPLCIYLSLLKTELWLIFLLAVPIQILLTIYFLLKKQK